MFTFKRTAADDCGCDITTPANDNTAKAPKKSLKAIFSRCAMCVGGAGGGLLAGHAGCIITPVVLATAGVTGLTAGMPLLALAFSAAATAGGLYAWHRLRGHQAGKWEKRIVVGGALAGVLVSSAFQIGGHHHMPGMDMPDMSKAPMCTGMPKAAPDTTVHHPTKPVPAMKFMPGMSH